MGMLHCVNKRLDRARYVAIVCVWLLVWTVGTASGDGEGTLSVVGTVRLEGPRPKRKRINMMADPQCAMVHRKARSERYLVDEDGGIANVMVHVKQGHEQIESEPVTEEVLLDQVGCVYKPRVFGVMVGQPVRVRNSDATLHNVHGIPTVNPGFNFGQPVKGMEEVLVFKAAEQAIVIRCDVHPWMVTYGWVFKHPFHAVTDDAGRFSIGGLPPGQYVLEAWHEALGRSEQRVTVRKGEPAEITFTFERKKKKQ